MRILPACLLLTFLVCAVSLARADVLPAKPATGAADQQRLPTLGQGQAEVYANQVFGIAEEIAREYVQPVQVERLAAHAILGLYAATGAPLPEHLRGDPDTLFLGKNVKRELAKARLALGNPSVISFQFRKDVSLSIQAMMTTLDPYCVYLSTSASLSTSQMSLGTVGLLLEERDPGRPCVIQTVVPFGPAQQAGLLPGDEVLAVRGVPVPPNRPARVVMQDMDRHGSPDGPPVELTIRSPHGGKPRQVKVMRAFLREESLMGHRRTTGAGQVSWDYLLGTREKIALIRLGAILSEDAMGGPGTADQLTNALATLQQNGLAGLVLDLRDCPGGSMDGAVEIASLFMPDGVLASVRYRNQVNPPPLRASRTENGLYRTPMVVLVGPNTMGGAELIAAALQDHKRAVIVGQRTRGKASIQVPKTLSQEISSHHQVRLTTGYFLRPSGGNLNRFADSKPDDEWGVRPDRDYEVRLPPIMLRQVRVWRLRQDMGTPDLSSGLPPDRLENDPVLHVGVECLRKKK
jgi:carboxyl-terminal processing protease